ncbi:MAG: DUF1343 domain-containing protein [Acidobacteriota bacterium]
MMLTGLDRLLLAPGELGGRSFALLAHGASVTLEGEPAHLALVRRGMTPRLLLGPEHGYHGIEQDMVPAEGGREPWTGVPTISLYGDGEDSLRAVPEMFEGIDLLLIDLQDVGSRYYTYAATAVWAAEAALQAECEVWLLDRPNPLGGVVVEGPTLKAGFESFVGAFRMPVRHGLTVGEIFRLEARRRRWSGGWQVWAMEGWRRDTPWRRPWVAPSPNMPSLMTAAVYPGMCLLEASELSEGRGTTRPFELAGAPWIDPVGLSERLNLRGLPGVRFLPVYFRPQFQKHAGVACGGLQLVVSDLQAFRPLRVGVEVLAAFRESSPSEFRWREAPYEFVSDVPAIDLLTGDDRCRRAIEGGDREALDRWLASWERDEAAFVEERRDLLLYEGPGSYLA